MDAQTYDMYILGWTNIGADPNDDSFWSSKFDVVGSGFNNTSYQNEKIDKLLVQGYSVPGCKTEDRTADLRARNRSLPETTCPTSS